MVTITLHCRYCGSDDLVRHGKPHHHQRYRCRSCGKSFQLNYDYPACRPDTSEEIESMAHNGSGIRDTARHLHIQPDTVVRHLKNKASQVKYLNHALVDYMLDLPERQVRSQLEVEVEQAAEADEQWSWVGKKAHQRWLWYIIDKYSGRVLAFCFGRRNKATFRKLIALLPKGLLDRLDTDGLDIYQQEEAAFAHRVGKAYTVRIERKMLDLRTRIKRLARKTLCFSKSEQVHDAVIGRFINLYMF
jgi:IS1 family transposase/transposase-like protein